MLVAWFHLVGAAFAERLVSAGGRLLGGSAGPGAVAELRCGHHSCGSRWLLPVRWSAK